ncbi:hypothetical protein USDA257_c30400 [Sinorhizobium fredii USDA 257]|uniref:Uncharacterized protein n=2 Tax=Rhizobium fredii TaxID=380 RepID=I3X6V4_SINF2|nr:hypothetical protein USDA257_c30400 [Sinorhizobium fredii USDA 257]
MLAIRKTVAEEEIEERRPPLSEARPRATKDLLPMKAEERENLDDPKSLFWRGVWMVVF